MKIKYSKKKKYIYFEKYLTTKSFIKLKKIVIKKKKEEEKYLCPYNHNHKSYNKYVSCHKKYTKKTIIDPTDNKYFDIICIDCKNVIFSDIEDDLINYMFSLYLDGNKGKCELRKNFKHYIHIFTNQLKSSKVDFN